MPNDLSFSICLSLSLLCVLLQRLLDMRSVAPGSLLYLFLYCTCIGINICITCLYDKCISFEAFFYAILFWKIKSKKTWILTSVLFFYFLKFVSRFSHFSFLFHNFQIHIRNMYESLCWSVPIALSLSLIDEYASYFHGNAPLN